MDGVAISIIGRPRPLPGHDTPNPAHNTYTLKCEEPLRLFIIGGVVGVWACVQVVDGLFMRCCPGRLVLFVFDGDLPPRLVWMRRGL